MAIRTYKVTLDSKNTIAPEPVYLRQGDKTGAVVIDATLMDNGSPVSLSGLTPMFKANTADGQAVIADSTGFTVTDSANGEFTYQVPNSLSSVPGKITTAYFSLSDADGSESTFDVAFIIKAAVDITQKQAEDYITIIDGTLDSLRDQMNSLKVDFNKIINNYNMGDFYNKQETDSKDAATLSSAETYTDNSLSGIVALPETFANLAAIKAKYPSGKNGLMVAADNGHKYIYSNSAWVDAGVYQSVGIADESITNAKLASKSVSRDKLDFQTPDFTNLFSLSDYVADEYYDLNGTLIKKGESGYLPGFGRTALIPISNGKVIYRNEKAGYNDGDNVYITFFADSAGQSLISSRNIRLSIPVPEGAAYFSMAVHERAKSKVIITIDQPIKYIDPSLNIDFSNLSRIPYTNDQARLVPFHYVSDYLTIDYVNEQVIIKKESGLAIWGSNFKWIHGAYAGTSAKTDLIYTFAEIRAMTSSEYQYLFIKRVSASTDVDRDIFMFTGQNQFADSLGVIKGTRNSIAADYVFIGFFSTSSISYSFPGTPLKVITTTASLAKNISILGDSISTFSGYIPSGNAAFFPNSFINNVDQTWWKSVINKNSLSLLLNNSWSGSRVTNTRTEEQAGYYRALHMDKDGISPDILIIYLGINDFNNNVKLGDYGNDLDTDFPTDGSTFKNAYAMMLDNATKTYPDCKIFTCTLPFSDSPKTGKVVHRNSNNDTLWDFNNAIRDISNQFGTTIIDLAQTGFNRNNAAHVLGDGRLHPNETGMKLIAKKVNFYLQETLVNI